MFDKILIKSGSQSTDGLISIQDIVDMMFYYGEVHVVVSQFELRQLLQVFGEDVLYELIISKRLFVHPCDQHIGAVRQNETGLCSAGMFRRNLDSIEKLLYVFHRDYIKNSVDNMRFASKFSKVLEEYRYPSLVQESIYRDIENDAFFSKATQTFIKQYYPTYHNPDEIVLHAEPFPSQLDGMYKIEGNIRLDEISNIHHSLGYPGDFSYSNTLLAIGETNQDCFLSSELNSALITNNRWAEVYKLRMNECVKRTEKSKDDINYFHTAVAFEFFSPGEAFSSGQITSIELLKLLTEKNSVKFRDWLKTIPDDIPLTGEFYNEIRKMNSDKAWVKCIRVVSQSTIGLLNTVAGLITTTIDGFICDKLINGWKPCIFVENVLRDNRLKKNKQFK